MDSLGQVERLDLQGRAVQVEPVVLLENQEYLVSLVYQALREHLAYQGLRVYQEPVEIQALVVLAGSLVSVISRVHQGYQDSQERLGSVGLQEPVE